MALNIGHVNHRLIQFTAFKGICGGKTAQIAREIPERHQAILSLSGALSLMRSEDLTSYVAKFRSFIFLVQLHEYIKKTHEILRLLEERHT